MKKNPTAIVPPAQTMPNATCRKMRERYSIAALL
jgi:hypothetical protein